MPNSAPDSSALTRAAARPRDEMIALLQQSIRLPSPSGQEAAFTHFIADWAGRHGFQTDLWETDEAAVAPYPQGQARHLPLAGRPTLVVKLAGRGQAEPLILNAHADVVTGEAEDNLWSGELREKNLVYGRGAVDDKGPLVGALWAMLVLQELVPAGLPGDLLLELIPGEEDAVGLGTLTSLLRGYRGRGVIILEPTANIPRCASRPGLRFEVICHGVAVHGTVKWLGRDAIASLRRVLDALDTLQARWNDSAADPLFAAYPIARPVTVDRVEAGRWQGMVCSRSLCAGYFELLPADDLEAWRDNFERELRASVPDDALAVGFTEQYAGHRTAPDDRLCRAARETVEALGGPGVWPGWSAFNSGCEAGLRFTEHGTPTLVWGPGGLVQAHAAGEFIDVRDVESFARMLADFAVRYFDKAGLR
jgi:acetylornithine deacetylase